MLLRDWLIRYLCNSTDVPNKVTGCRFMVYSKSTLTDGLKKSEKVRAPVGTLYMNFIYLHFLITQKSTLFLLIKTLFLTSCSIWGHSLHLNCLNFSKTGGVLKLLISCVCQVCVCVLFEQITRLVKRGMDGWANEIDSDSLTKWILMDVSKTEDWERACWDTCDRYGQVSENCSQACRQTDLWDQFFK